MPILSKSKGRLDNAPTSLITLDIGNSQAKVYLWENDQICERGSEAILARLTSLDRDTLALLSQVGELGQETLPLLEALKKRNIPVSNIKNLHHESHFLEMPIHYAKTLGIDRILFAHAVFCESHLSPSTESHSLLLDFGSFNTFDLVSKRGFLGGYIFPGKAQWPLAYEKGKLLKEFAQEKSKEKSTFDLPQNSIEAIHSSYFLSTLSSISFLIEHYHPKKIYISGGEAKDFLSLVEENLVKKSEKAEIKFCPDIVSKQLYQIGQEVSKDLLIQS